MLYWLSFLLFLLPTLVSAQQFIPIVGIPGVDPNADFSSYINALYALSISIAGLLAVIKLVIAGVKYMATDIVTSKGDAKKDIQGALFGLLVVMSAVLILTVINEDLTNADISIIPADRVERREEVGVETTIERIFRTCDESVTCSIETCDGDAESGYDCTNKMNECRSGGGDVSDYPSESRVLCIKAGAGSVVEAETEAGITAADIFMDENPEYSEIRQLYAINSRNQETNEDIQASDMRRLSEEWETACMEDSAGEETGNTYIDEEVIVNQSPVFIRMCVR